MRNDRHRVQPKASTTPKMNKAKRTKHTKLKPEERLTIFNINCRSVNNKILEPHQVIDQVQPDINDHIICLTEKWLKHDIHTAEIFPCHLGYQIYRDDRTLGKGVGVLLAVTVKFLSQEQPELKTNCNII